jgi:hypothetical protein
MVQGQYNNNFWLFGDSVGINWSESASPVLFTTMLKGRGSCCFSLSDSSGSHFTFWSQDNYLLIDQSKTYNKFGSIIPLKIVIVSFVEAWYHEMFYYHIPGNDSLVYLIYDWSKYI